MALRKISELTAASALDGTESVEVVQAGNSRQTTVSELVADALLSSNVALYNASPAWANSGFTTRQNFTGAANAANGGAINVKDTSPTVIWSETDQGTDLKNWGWQAATGVFRVITTTDDNPGSAVTTPLRIVRGTTTSVSEIELNATLLDFNGNVDVSGSILGNKVFPVNAYATNTTPGTTDMTAAVAAAFAAADGGGVVWFNPGETYLVDDLMSMTSPTNIRVALNGATIKSRLTVKENVWTFLEPENVVIEHGKFDGGFGVTTFSNHIISMRSPVNCKVMHCDFEDWEETAVLMFGNGTDAVEDCLIFDCFGDGGGVGNLGFMIGDCIRSKILGSNAINVLGTAPGYTFQLKNFCEDSHILDCTAENCHVALSFSAPDEADTVGTGALHCTARVIAKNCVAPVFIEKTNECEIEVNADMANNSGSTAAVVCNARNIGTRVSLNVKNCHSTVPVVKHSSSDFMNYYVRQWDGLGAFLWDIGDGGAQPGAEWNRMILEHLTLNSSSFEPVNAINDDSGETTNQFCDLRNLSHNELSGNTLIPVPVAGSNRLTNYFQFSSTFFRASHNGVIKNLGAPVAATTAQLADITHAINTTDKYLYKAVVNTTTGIWVYANDATAGGVWRKQSDGTTAHTPV